MIMYIVHSGELYGPYLPGQTKTLVRINNRKKYYASRVFVMAFSFVKVYTDYHNKNHRLEIYR